VGILQDKRIVITGGSMGIGLAVATECAREGASVTLVSRHADDLANAVEMLPAGDHGHDYFCVDVGEPDQVKQMADTLKENRGSIDGLVNCAGIYGPIGKSDEIDPTEFTNTIRINLLGTFYMCHYFIPLLKKSQRGKIVNYSGGGAAGPFPNYSAYATSKTAVVRLTENLSLEFQQDNIDINVVAPGFVVTRLHKQTIEAGKNAGEEFLRKTQEQFEKGGVSPDVPAKLTVFLLSSGSDGITGRFLSAPWDRWADSDFLDKIRSDKDFAQLRRIDDKQFFKRD
jgi:3-oxoacyl-[acyl-carrier protein] reductase